jgi:hypothetical protein
MNMFRIVLCVAAWVFVPAFCRGLNFHVSVSPFDTTLTCNTLVNISLDENCSALIEPDDILEGYTGNISDYTIEIKNYKGELVNNPVTGQYIDSLLYVKVFHNASGNSCWGQALIEDKWKPTVTCSNYTIQCIQNPATAPLPQAWDNCDPSPTVKLINETIDDSKPCTGVIITRTFIAIDDKGNVSSPCSQVYTTVQPSLPDFPNDIIWECDVYNTYPMVISAKQLTGNPATTGSGVPNVAIGNYCPYNVTHSDVTLQGCGNTFSIVRTWTVFNWCTGQVITVDINGDDNVQIIKVKDTNAPVLTMDPYTVGANIEATNHNGCVAVNFLPPANVAENCHSWTLQIFTPVGEAIYVNGQDGKAGGIIPQPGLPLGEHLVTYVATDACGNYDTLKVLITVADETAPVAVCDEITSVSLDNQGMAKLFANNLDDGSHDNCCMDSFSVRRMTSPCNPADTLFGPYVNLCCIDVGTPVTVVFRAVDCAGNHNDCMVLVDVEDKLPPALVSCPTNQTIKCDFYADSLSNAIAIQDFLIFDQFGLPNFQDNCKLNFLEASTTLKLDQCLDGTVIRRWRATDPGKNNILTCQQLIFVQHVSDWVVEFPSDVTVNCTDTLPPTGEPKIFFETCELVATSFSDQVFTVVPDACFKIIRNWTVINWCVVGPVVSDEVMESSEVVLNFDLNGDGQKNNRTFQDGLNNTNFSPLAFIKGAQPDGYVKWQQTIMVNDTVKPVVTCPPVIEVCILENDCDVTFDLPLPDVQDCSSKLLYSATGDLGTGLGPFVNVKPGTYKVTFKVDDSCNNSNSCSTNILVKDCKFPTPFCINGLIVNLDEDSVAIVFPEDFDAGSYDNCDGPLMLSFSPNVNDTVMMFDCFDVSMFITVQIWVTDAAGNQDFCETFVFVSDNMGVCQGPPKIEGLVVTEKDIPVAKVEVGLNGTTQGMMKTNADGKFSFQVPLNGDYTLTPVKDTFPLNGVTTFDLVLISRHILGITPLDSPYKIIAADANKSNSVTTADMVAIRKLILQITDSFPNNRSWRFIDKNYVFPDPKNPFAYPIPEVLNFNNLNYDVLKADFIGVKVGDVNGSVDPGQ